MVLKDWEDLFSVQISVSEVFSFVGSSELTRCPETRIHKASGRRFYRKKKKKKVTLGFRLTVAASLRVGIGEFGA